MRGKTSTSDRLPNPATKFLQWNGKQKAFIYYDKEAVGKDEDGNEKVGMNVSYDLKDFLVLTTRASIGGWSDEHNAKVWSNEVGRIGEDTLYVMAGSEKITEGIYKEVKDTIVANGGKFQSIIYAYNLKAKELVRLSLKGGALGSFMDWKTESKVNPENVTLTLIGSEKKKKGAVTYYVPTFDSKETTEKEEALVEPIVNDLEEYFTSFKSENKAEEVSIHDDADIEEKAITDLPF